MTRGTTTRLLHALEIAYAVATLFVLTQGPVLRLWRPSEASLPLVAEPSIKFVYFASYLLVQTPGLMLWARRANKNSLISGHKAFLFAFLSWLGMTVMWSTLARQSLPEFLAIVFTSMFGMYLASSFSLTEFWLVAVLAMTLGVGLSWISVMRLWEGAVNFQENYWIGIYYNRNSLAPVAATAVVAAGGLLISLLVSQKRLKTFRLLLSIAVLVILTIFAAMEIVYSRSQTAPLALVLGAMTCGTWVLWRFATTHSLVPDVVRRLSGVASIMLVSTGVFAVIRLDLWNGEASLRRTAFNQRSGLWSISWSGFLEKPWHGWGWMAAWRNPLFFLSVNQPKWTTWGMEWSHSGYFDILLGGGVVALVMFVAFVLLAFNQLGNCGPFEAIPRMWLASFVLASATQESFFVGSHFMWALLVAALAVTEGDHHASVNQNHSDKLTTGTGHH